MTVSIFILIVIILLAIVLFVFEIVTVDTTAFLVMVLLMVFGIVTPEEGLSGFSNVGTISVFALLVLSIGLESTGAVNYFINKIENYANTNELLNIIAISIVAGVLSAFLNNTAIVAIMLPVVVRLAHLSKISPAKLLMPLSFAAMAGGCITIIGTSTNVIISGIYDERYGEPFSIFEFSILGIVLFCIYLLYMLLIGRKLLPNQEQQESLLGLYELDRYLTQVVVQKKSSLIGQKIGEDFHEKYGIRVLEIIREGGNVRIPSQVEQIKEQDVLNIKCRIDSLMEMHSKLGLKIKRNIHLDDKELTSEDTVLFEAVIGNNSYLLGKQIKDIDFRQLFEAVPLAVHRSGEALPTLISEVEIRFGDTILMEARRKKLDKFNNSRDFIVIDKLKKPNYRNKHMRRASLIIVGVVACASFGVFPLEVASLTGCVLMFLSGCVSPRYVYRKMEWRIIFLLAGMIPLGVAVEKTGLSVWLVTGILDYFGQLSPTYIISGLFLVTVIITSFMSNNATAILLAPIAITLADQLGLDAKPFLVTVMFGASTSFLTPIGYQTNTLIYGPGKYRFIDYLKVGGLLTLLVWLAATFLIPRLYI